MTPSHPSFFPAFKHSLMNPCVFGPYCRQQNLCWTGCGLPLPHRQCPLLFSTPWLCSSRQVLSRTLQPAPSHFRADCDQRHRGPHRCGEGAPSGLLRPCVPARAPCGRVLSWHNTNHRGNICEVWGPFVPTQRSREQNEA
jgi:hypothetical protein